MIFWKISYPSGSSVLRFAADELIRCLESMDERLHIAPLEDGAAGLCLRVEPSAFPVKEPALDDAYRVEFRAGAGEITGSNERSVLLGAYRLLNALGCTWVRPGADGEYLPKRPLDEAAVSLAETPSYRHRGVCIEGSCAYEHVRDMIDWLPKIGMNSYYIQFMLPYTFFNRWYSHNGNPYETPVPFSEADVAALKNRIEGEIKRRGLLYHAVGHGWTCEPFGIPGNSWDKREYTVPEDAKALLAEVNGKRELWGGIPLNTNLCYSNPEVVERMSGAIADYCERNPQIDYLHVWLADGKNNHCECESCRRARPSDLYVRLLNEIDRKLTERGLPARIVFLIYVDLLWAPETERLHNPDRFTLMFAPITRTYTTPFCDSLTGELPAAPPYERNRLTMPRDVASNVAHLRDWQRSFPGDGFDFDYHLMWDHFRDLGAFGTAKVLFEDMQNLDRLGLGGMMSCQLQRCFFPNGLMMRAMAEALRDKNAGFDAAADAYMRECYGADAPAVSAYLRRLTRLSDAVYLRQEKPAADPEAAAGYAEIPAAVSEMHGLIEERCRTAHSRAERVNWELLRIHGEYCVRIAAAFEARANGEPERARQLYERTVDFLRRTEPEYHPAFDLGLFQSVIRPLFP